MASFICILSLRETFQKESNWTESENHLIGRHFAYLQELTERGVMKLVGKADYDVPQPDNKGYAIFEATDRDSVEKILNDDAAVKEGLMSAELHPFRMALVS